MNLEQARTLLADSLKDNLPDADRNNLARFESEQPDFKKEADRVREQWTAVVAMRQEKAPPEVSENFYRMLGEFEQSTERDSVSIPRFATSWWKRTRALQWIGALGILIAGVVIGRYSIESNIELDSLRQEVAYLDKMVTMTMLEQSSASRRLAAVERSGSRLVDDPEMASALLETLRYDPNVNVRLAALHALNPGTNATSEFRKKVWDAAREQNSPLVTATLIELWAASPDAGTRSDFESLLSENPDSLLEPQIRRAIESLQN